MRVVQFGAGRIGKIHARNIASHPRSTLYGIVDPVEEAGKALAEQYDTKFMEETDALGDPQVDALIRTLEIVGKRHRLSNFVPNGGKQ